MVALVDRDDPYHARSAATVRTLPPEPLVTTWQCVTEAMHLLARSGGHPAQEKLWGFFARRTIRIYYPDPVEEERMRALMRQYRDTPMDLADASLVSAAERLDVRRVFTLDGHFHAYRTSRGPMEVVR